MKNDWFTRLLALIEESEKDMKAISKEAGLGPNYISQMSKNGKHPSVDRFLKIMKVLGEHKTMWVLTGRSVTKDDQEFLRAVSALSDDQKRLAIDFFRSLREQQENQSQ